LDQAEISLKEYELVELVHLPSSAFGGLIVERRE
jgi:hypothetical protein